MSKPQTTEDWDGEYERLRARLGQIGWLALGTLIERGLPGQGGPRYQWSRRAKGKTVTVALSAEQFAWMKMAVANQREVWEILLRLQQLSAEFMLPNLPGPRRRNRLSKKRFGLI